MMKSILFSIVIVFSVVSYSEANTGDCINTSGNQRSNINLGAISLSQSTNVANHIIYDQEFSTTLLTATCDCPENWYVPTTKFSGNTNNFASFVDNFNGFTWYTLPGNSKFAYSFQVDLWNEWTGRTDRLSVPFDNFSNGVPESNCKGPATLSSLTRGRLQIRLLEPITGYEDFNAPVGYLKMRRAENPTSSTPVMRMVNVSATVFSGHYCGATGAFTNKYTFKTSFLSDFDDQMPSENDQIGRQTHITNIYCNYSNVPVEIEFTGDFSAYGLKTDLDGVEIKSVLSVGTFGTNYVINNVWNKFTTSLDSKGYKRIQFTSAPVLTKPKSQVTLGEYSATMRIRVNFK
ncbi:hypothetical protein P3436_15835 [Vibrio parahaemolyticus]|nr:hypothetical protein [Vibrio parahaemolyticus]